MTGKPMRIAPLAAILLAFAVACGGSGASPSPSPSPSPAPSPSPSPSPTPSPSPSPVPTPTPEPTIDLSQSYPKQGGFLMVRLLDAPAGLPDAAVAFNGKQYAMLREGDRWFAMVGMGTSFQVGDYPIEVDSSSAGAVAAGTVSIADGGFQYESIDLPPSSADLTSDQDAVNRERATLNQTYAAFTPERRWSGDWILPAQGTPSDGYGLMRSINGAPYYPHSGTDIANEIGTPVVASNNGVVALAGPLYLFGNAVIIDHGAGVFSSYNHLNSIVAQAGQVVRKGDLLGYMGQTG